MQRTTIVLPEPLKRRSMERARAAGVSFAEFIRKAVELALSEPLPESIRRNRQAALRAMRDFREDAPSAGPSDLTKNLDDYLYGSRRKSKS